MNQIKAWAVFCEDSKIPIGNVAHYSRPLEKNIYPWAIFTSQEEAQEAAEKSSQLGRISRAVEVIISWE